MYKNAIKICKHIYIYNNDDNYDIRFNKKSYRKCGKQVINDENTLYSHVN